MKPISVRFELRGNRRYDAFFRRLHRLGADPVMNSEWWLHSQLSLEEIEKDLRNLIDPADRLLVAYVGAMFSRNLINKERLAAAGAA